MQSLRRKIINNANAIYLCLPDIKADPTCQARVAMNDAIIDDYAEIMKEKGDYTFPPVVVFYDGTDHWLADGFHRYQAAKRAGMRAVMIELHEGSRRDAILHAVRANAYHGLRRTRDDKRRAVSILLEDAEWGKWSNRKIAERCGVDEKMVRTLRSASAAKPQITRTVERNGKAYDMITDKIGRNDGVAKKSPPLQQSDFSPEPEQVWDHAPQPETDDPAVKLVDDRPVSSRQQEDDSEELQELMSLWSRTSEEVRRQFLVGIGVSPVPQVKAGSRLVEAEHSQEPELSQEPARSQRLTEAAEQSVEALVEMWEGYKGHTKTYGRNWVEAGCPDGALPNEHWTRKS